MDWTRTCSMGECVSVMVSWRDEITHRVYAIGLDLRMAPIARLAKESAYM